MTPRTITGAHRIYVLPKERNKSEYVDYCAQSTTLVEALTKDSLVEHLIIKCSDPWGFVFPEQLVSQTEREKPLRITLLLTEHIDHVRGNLPHWEEFVARARTEGMLKGQVYKSGWQDCVVPRGVYVPSGLMTRIACRDKGKYASNFPDPTKGGKQEDNFTYRFITDASLATGSTAEELAQIRAYFGVGVDLSHSFKPIRKIKNGIVTDTQADMWVYEFLYARQMIEAHGASSGVYMNMLYWLNASEANITDFWEVAETTENTARGLEGKLDKPEGGSYVLDAEIPDLIKDTIKVGGRNLFRKEYFIGEIASLYKIPFDTLRPRDGNNTYTLSLDYKISPDDKASTPRITCFYQGSKNIFWDSNVVRDGEWHHKEYTIQLEKLDPSEYPIYGWLTDYGSNNGRTIDMVAVRNIKLERGNVATDWTPAPEDIQSEIKDLQKNSPTPFQKDWLNKMGQVLLADGKESGKTYHLNGVSIDRSMFLRFSGDTPSAIIGGQSGKGAVLMAGVQDYGTNNQSARTEIYQDGSAKFGAVELLYNGLRIKNDPMQLFADNKAVREPLLISDTQPEFVESLALSNVENRNVVSGANVYLTNSTRTRQYNFSTSNPSTKMTITIERVRCEVYPRNCVLEMLLDGVQIMSWRGDISYEQVDGSDFVGGGSKLNIHKTPSEETNISIEYMLPRGSHTLLLRNTSTDSTDKGTFYGLKCNLFYDASKGSTILSASGFRAYTNNSRYFDIDRREKYYPPDTSGGGGDDDLIPAEGVTNPYIARIRGGILLDRLDLEQPLDAPGCVLAGGEVDSSGSVNKSFGKYKKRVGYSEPKTDFDYNTHIYTIYHSIGNRGYIPIVTSRSSAWADLPRVMSVDSNSFTIAFINETNTVSDWRQPFIYTCYKAD